MIFKATSSCDSLSEISQTFNLSNLSNATVLSKCLVHPVSADAIQIQDAICPNVILEAGVGMKLRGISSIHFNLAP